MIRQMLGCPKEDAEAFQQERDKFSGDADLDASEADAEGYPCPACGQGRMVRGKVTPRPTVPQILAIPFLIWTAIAQDGVAQQQQQREQREQQQQRQEQEPKSPEREEAVLDWPTELPPGELRQQLLPLPFW
jgi:hypothetical protein